MGLHALNHRDDLRLIYQASQAVDLTQSTILAITFMR